MILSVTVNEYLEDQCSIGTIGMTKCELLYTYQHVHRERPKHFNKKITSEIVNHGMFRIIGKHPCLESFPLGMFNYLIENGILVEEGTSDKVKQKHYKQWLSVEAEIEEDEKKGK